IVGDLDRRRRGRIGAGFKCAPPDGIEQRLAAGERVLRAADHHSRLARRHHFWPGEHRCGDENLLAFLMRRREFFDDRDAMRAGANMNATLRQGLQQATITLGNLCEGSVIWEHGEYRHAITAGLLDRIQRLRAASNDVFYFLRRAVVDANVVIGLEQTAGHDLSHAAKPDESDLHADSLLLKSDRPFSVILRRSRVARLSRDEWPTEARDKGILQARIR